ncbi:hypothetical protein BC828DRAFT_378165 [Blastocladiella britannica]|nr:hypothetical protein BC828DRAFT_378165 [Blastocladiella britannica]
MVLLLTDLPGDVLPTLGRALASENAVQALRAACRSMYTAPGLLVHYRALTATVAIATFHDASMATNAIYSTRRHPQAATATQIYLRVVQNLVNTPLNDPRPWEALGTIAIPCPDGGKDDGNDADAVAAMLAIPAAADSPDMVPRVCSLLSRNGSAVPENLWVPFTMALVLRQMRVYAALRGPDGAVYKCLGSVKGDAVRARFVAGYSPESRHQSMNAFDLVLGLEDMDNIPQVLAAINAIESLILRPFPISFASSTH